MEFLARDTVPLGDNFWNNIDKTVVETMRRHLVGRRFLSLYGPIGAGAISIHIDENSVNEEENNGIIKTEGRHFVEIPQLFEDFLISWRDLEHSEITGFPLDLTKVIFAAQNMAKKEDKLIFYGNQFLGYEGLFSAKGIAKINKSDWSEGENAFLDIVSGIASFGSKGLLGRYTLAVSPDVYVKFQRILPGIGILESDRINKLLDGRFINAPILEPNSAILLCPEPQYMDFVIGKDAETGYLETKEFNHVLRIIETGVLRIKNRDAIIVFE